MRSAPTLNSWMMPFSSVAMIEKLALVRIAFCSAPAFARAGTSAVFTMLLALRGQKAEQRAGCDADADGGPRIGAHVLAGGDERFPGLLEHRLRRVGQRGLGGLQFLLEQGTRCPEAFVRHRSCGLQQVLAVGDHGPEIARHP